MTGINPKNKKISHTVMFNLDNLMRLLRCEYNAHFQISLSNHEHNKESRIRMNKGGKSIFKNSENQMVCCKFSRHAQVVHVNLVRRDHYQACNKT